MKDTEIDSNQKLYEIRDVLKSIGYSLFAVCCYNTVTIV